jgi:putative DNA primase/helicase
MSEEHGHERRQQATVLKLTTQDGRRIGVEVETGGGGPPADLEIPVFASEEAMANVLVQTRLNGEWHYASDGRWYYFDARCWCLDEIAGVYDLARMVCRATAANDGLSATVRRSICSARSISGVERIARTDRAVAVAVEAFDNDPWVFNTPDGLVDLRTGELLPHDKNRLCMRLAGASPQPGIACPTWRRFLYEVTGGDRLYQAYLLRLIGYSLLGVTPEEIFVFLWGPANTGKSKFVECLRLIHASYGTGAPMETFSVAKGERHPTDLAGFVGRRLVTAAETEEGRRWDQQRLTTLTGRDRIQARFMRGDFFEYTPQFLLVFHGNYRPRLSGVSDAMKRRLYLLPFRHKPAKIDKYLIDKFRAELPGIMAMAVEGCLEYQRIGLSPPSIVTDATEDYFMLEDQMQEWLEERCDRSSFESYATSRELHQDFARFMHGRGFVPSEQIFIARLEGVEGLRRSRRLPNGRRGFWGIALRGHQPELQLDRGGSGQGELDPKG